MHTTNQAMKRSLLDSQRFGAAISAQNDKLLGMVSELQEEVLQLRQQQELTTAELQLLVLCSQSFDTPFRHDLHEYLAKHAVPWRLEAVNPIGNEGLELFVKADPDDSMLSFPKHTACQSRHIVTSTLIHMLYMI
jgi:hypothetical protein